MTRVCFVNYNSLMEIEVGDEIVESMNAMILENDDVTKKLMLKKDVLNPNHISVLNFGSCT